MLRKILLSAVALTFVAGSAAVAQGPAAGKAQTDPRQDRGVTSRIDVETFGSRRMNALKSADADGDGKLSIEELAAHIQKRKFERRARKMSRMLDVDGDGVVTIAELERRNEKLFALIDSNDDGEVSREEMRRAHRSMAATHTHRGHDMHHGRKHSRGEDRHHRRKPGMERPARADAPAETVTPDAPAKE